MHASVEAFLSLILLPASVAGKEILEVGSRNVNGSPRERILGFGPSRYVGIDLIAQPTYVDVAADAADAPRLFGPSSFDVVIATEMLEHADDWRKVLSAVKEVLRPGGLLVLTTRSEGYEYHAPPDRWRFSRQQVASAMNDFETIALLDDLPLGVLFAGRKKGGPVADLSEIAPTAVEAPYHSQEAFETRLASRRANHQTPQPLSVWYHVACMGDWRTVFDEQCQLLEHCGLRATACVLGSAEEAAEVGTRVSVAHRSPDLHQYETPTLSRLWQWCGENEAGAAMYLHTKGVSAPGDLGKKAWRELMQICVVAAWQENLDRLAVADMVGVDWQDNPRYPHFAGNFWMARADWIARLPSPEDYRRRGGPMIAGHGWDRMSSEMWLGSRPYHHIESLACRNTNLWSGEAVFSLRDQARKQHGENR